MRRDDTMLDITHHTFLFPHYHHHRWLPHAPHPRFTRCWDMWAILPFFFLQPILIYPISADVTITGPWWLSFMTTTHFLPSFTTDDAKNGQNDTWSTKACQVESPSIPTTRGRGTNPFLVCFRLLLIAVPQPATSCQRATTWEHRNACRRPVAPKNQCQDSEEPWLGGYAALWTSRVARTLGWKRSGVWCLYISPLIILCSFLYSNPSSLINFTLLFTWVQKGW